MTDQSALENHVVLIVEDEEPARRVFTKTLESHGYQVLQAGSAEEALKVANTADHIDVLLMDIMLPDSWGTQLAESIRLLHSDVRVVLASGYAKDDPILMSGIDPNSPFLHKPFEMEELVEAVAGTASAD